MGHDANGQVLTLTSALQALFPPHPLAFNRLTKLEGVTKTAPLVRKAATVADYAAHLAPEAFGGVGALGMFPGVALQGGEGRDRWYATFLAGDFDGHLPDDLAPLVNTLEGFGLPVYLTCGTSGRGGHLYAFVEGLLPQWRAHEALKGLQRIAEDAGLGTPEIRPSCRAGRGSPIFLPYRGALKDGFGFNPLLDPGRDLLPVGLEHAVGEVRRVPAEALEAFGLELAKRNPPPKRVARTRVPTDSAELKSKDALTALRDEIARVKEHFREPHRQNLVMALAAYGARGLKLGAATVREEVAAFVRANDPDDLPRRLSALEFTLKKYAADPVSVAWVPYYRSAGLNPPGKLGVSEIVLSRLEVVVRRLLDEEWKGLAGASDRSVFVALILLAAEHGTPHRSGVAVSVSVRDLALQSGVGDKTLRTAFERLKGRRLVEREHLAVTRSGDAGRVVLMVGGVPDLPHSFPLLGGLKEWGYLYTHPAFRHGKLGKSAAPPLVVLLTARGPLTRPELAHMLGRESRALRGPLNKLLRHGIVKDLGATFTLSPEWEEALERAAGVTGGYITEARQRQTHLNERLVFHVRRKERLNARSLPEAA